MAIRTFNNVVLKIIHDTLENLNTNNPILQDGEMGYVSGKDEVNTLKFGNGINDWKTLNEFVPNNAKNAITVNGITIIKDGKIDISLISNLSSDNLDASLYQQIENKVDKEAGKGLSTNDFTNEYKTMIESMMPEHLAFLTGSFEGENLPTIPLDADTLQGHNAEYFVSNDKLNTSLNEIKSEINQDISEKATTKTYNVTVTTSWEGQEPPYTQTISVEGIIETDNPIVDIILNNDTETAKKELMNYVKISDIVTYDASIKIICLEAKTEIPINIQLKVIR